MADPFTNDPVGRLFKAASDAVDARLAANPPRPVRRRRTQAASRPRPALVDDFSPPADACFCAVTAFPPCSYCEQHTEED